MGDSGRQIRRRDQGQGATLMTYLSQSWVGHVASGEVTIMAPCGGGGGGGVELTKPNGLPGAVPQLHPPGERRSGCLQTDLQSGQIPVPRAQLHWSVRLGERGIYPCRVVSTDYGSTEVARR